MFPQGQVPLLVVAQPVPRPTVAYHVFDTRMACQIKSKFRPSTSLLGENIIEQIGFTGLLEYVFK